MNIRDPQKFLETQWDWTPFNEAFDQTRIRITDIDGAVERNGRLLFIETKLPGVEIPLGQKLLFDRLSQIPGVCVLIVWGKPNMPEKAQLWRRGEAVKTSREGMIAYVRSWFKWANSRPPLGGKQS